MTEITGRYADFEGLREQAVALRPSPGENEERLRAKAQAREAVGQSSDREPFLAGVALHWAEGSKDKTYSRRESLRFINSDPDVITLHPHRLDLLGVPRERMRFRAGIHE
ncbi:MULTISPECIES: hypothetical protein [unclassified Streptomyces]|uniref:hypothetical protein n=1 Tax=unclassified Streptomyces TaxID=2593676 RepID=UPI003824C329